MSVLLFTVQLPHYQHQAILHLARQFKSAYAQALEYSVCVCALLCSEQLLATSAGFLFSGQAQEASKQLEEALQAAEQQMTASRRSTSDKNAQLVAVVGQQLELFRGKLCHVCASQHEAPSIPRLPEIGRSDATGVTVKHCGGPQVQSLHLCAWPVCLL